MLRLLLPFLLLGALPDVRMSNDVPRVPAAEILSVSAPATVKNLRVPTITASGAILIDVTSGEVLFSKNASAARPMASLTKIMTALLILDSHDMDETVTVPRIAETIGGSDIGLEEGQRFALGDLLKAMLIRSANDVAYTLAYHHSGEATAFVRAMNQRSKTLGLTKTRFANPAGLDDPNQYSSARDIAWLMIAALKHPTFQSIVSTRDGVITSYDGKQFPLHNTNEILHSRLNVFGVKTGTTDAAGECLAILFTSGRRTYALVLLGSVDRYTDALRVMNAVSSRIASTH